MENVDINDIPQWMKDDLEGRKYTRKVGDTIEYDPFPGLAVGDLVATVIYVDDSHAIAELCFPTDWINPNLCPSFLSYEDVVNIIGSDKDLGKDNAYTDLYTAEGYFDAGSEMMGYERIWEVEAEYVAQAGEQAVTMLLPAKVYGKPEWNAIPMDDEELSSLGLEGETNCYRVIIPLTKQYSKRETPAGMDMNSSFIIYSRNNIAILASYDECELGEEVDYESLKKLPGFDFEDEEPLHYYRIDMVTGESNEEFKAVPMKTDDGVEYVGRVEGYHFVGNKVVARYMSIEMPERLTIVSDDELLAVLKGDNDGHREEERQRYKDEIIPRIKQGLESRRIQPSVDWTGGETELFRFDLESGEEVEFYHG